MDALLALEPAVQSELNAAARDGVTLSAALTITDGAKPREGIVVSLKLGRYRDARAEATDPDQEQAEHERAVIARAIADWFNERDPLLNEQIESLTDDIVAALAGE